MLSNQLLCYHNFSKSLKSFILQRADNKCQHCGIENYKMYSYTFEGDFQVYEYYSNLTFKDAIYISGIKNEILGWREYRITILAITYIDHDVMNNHPNNLLALCQRCKLKHTKSHKIINSFRNKRGNVMEFD